MNEEIDPHDTPEYDAYVEKCAATCDATDRPCGACLAGGICDGPDDDKDDDDEPDFTLDDLEWYERYGNVRL